LNNQNGVGWYNKVRFVVGSFDSDIFNEIVAVDGFVLRTFLWRCSTGWGPQELALPGVPGNALAMAAADLDGQGHLEIILRLLTGRSSPYTS